ncbi:unnamed protein product [Cylindrotheca closterium]|uniref:Triosephosphate isomerase n=1 Tax=Cylindrotheca closterium TaxID=2856 RepID=A0AAD2PV94_9STRA|nr:unnamed protein product [Cylindrotheca closterium]
MKFSATLLLSALATSSAFVAQQPSPSIRLGSTEMYARKAFITGNWKLNPQTKDEAIELATGIASAVTDDSPCDVALFVPFPYIESVQETVGDKVIIGAEATTPQINGAFTGGVSPVMLKSIGCTWALAGHSERRVIFKESDEEINEQCKMLIEHDMNVVLCIGETLEEFEKELVGAVCEIQLKKGLAGIDKKDLDKVTIAYEPVWAIGTGKVATPEIAQSVHETIRGILKGMYGEKIADSTRILYGGSVSPESVDGLVAKPDIDGALVGGASLNAEGFGRIINHESE